MQLNREISNLKSELEDQERDAEDILKKYQLHIHNYSLDSHRFNDLNNQIDILGVENRMLKDKLRGMEEKCSFYESSWVDRAQLNKMENKLREVENKLEFENMHLIRLQNHLDRVKQQYENAQNEIELILNREKKCEENLRRAQRHNKDILEEFGELKKKLIDYEESKKRIEQQNEILERELDSCRSEIKISQTRLEAFQNAFSAMNESESDDEDDDQIDDASELADEEDFSETIDSERGSSSKFLNVSMSKMSVKSGDLNQN